MPATLQHQALASKAYPFYVVDAAGEPWPVPDADDATLYVKDVRQTWIWHGGRWELYSGPLDLTPLLETLAALLLATREMRDLLELILARLHS